MSYQVLARKWRPQTFSELVGQQHVVDAITNALDNNKLHHAYLFTGTRGVGKTTIARIFSKSLNCEEGQSANPCGKCGTCLDISEGRFVDLLEIDAASRTKVEDTRELLDNVQYKPTRGKYKVYLIDEVHMLSKHSFNALLKTLEEPPPHVKFLLATTDPQKLPVTILSRCLQFSLKSLSREQIQMQLATILEAEQLHFELPALSQIARAAAGSMRDALSLTDQAIAQGNNQISLNTVVSMLGLLDKNQVLRLAKCICERDADNAMKQLDEICADSPDYSQVLSQLLALLHQVALTQIVPDICKLDTNIAKPIYTLAKAVSPEHIQLLYQIGLNGKRDLPFAPDALTGLQMTIIRMIAFSPEQSLPLEISAPTNSADSDDENTKDISDLQTDRVADTPSIASDEDLDYKSMPVSDSEQVTEDRLSESIELTPVVDAEESESNRVLESPNYDRAVNYEGAYQPAEQTNAPIDQHAPQTDTSNDSEVDPVAQLQDLFDMEQDIATYERQAVANDGVKKSESVVIRAPMISSSKNISQSFAEITEDHKNNDANYESNTSRAVDAVTISASRPILEAADTNAHADVEVETEITSEGSPTLETEIAMQVANSVNSNTLKAYLDNGEKLVLAAQIDKWSAFVDSLSVRGLARQLLIHGRSPGIKDNCLLLEISQAHHHLNEQSSINSVKEALAEKFQRNIDMQVKFSEVSNTPYQLQLQIDDMRLRHATNVIESDSAIQELVKAFDAKVNPDSIESR